MPPPAANGSFAGAPPLPPLDAPGHGPQPPLQRPASLERTGGRGERGPLLENVPRRMRVGEAASAEVRIARNKIDGLMQALNGRAMPQRSDVPLTRALTVRLRAPQGGFWIELGSPETQWVDSGSVAAPDEHAVWRWTIVPQKGGKGRLSLMVSARTIGPDGAIADAAPSDRMIEIKVGGAGHARKVLRLIAWLAAVGAGVALGHFGSQIWPSVIPLFRKLGGG